MLRFLFITILSLFSFVAGAQLIKPNNSYGIIYNRVRPDTLQGLPIDTFTVSGSLKNYPWIAARSGVLYLWNPAINQWVLAGGGGGVDTTYLSFRINQKQNALPVGSTSQYWNALGQLRILSDDVIAIGNGQWSLKGHTHVPGEVSGLPQFIRNQISVTGAGGSYDPSTGVINIPGGAAGTLSNVAYPLSKSGDTVKLTGLIDPSQVNSLPGYIRAQISANNPLLYDNTTGIFKLDTANATTGLATKARLYKALDSLRTLIGTGGSGGVNFTPVGSLVLNGTNLSLLGDSATVTGRKTYVREGNTGYFVPTIPFYTFNATNGDIPVWKDTAYVNQQILRSVISPCQGCIWAYDSVSQTNYLVPYTPLNTSGLKDGALIIYDKFHTQLAPFAPVLNQDPSLKVVAIDPVTGIGYTRNILVDDGPITIVNDSLRRLGGTGTYPIDFWMTQGNYMHFNGAIDNTGTSPYQFKSPGTGYGTVYGGGPTFDASPNGGQAYSIFSTTPAATTVGNKFLALWDNNRKAYIGGWDSVGKQRWIAYSGLHSRLMLWDSTGRGNTLNNGTVGQVLTIGASGSPIWSNTAATGITDTSALHTNVTNNTLAIAAHTTAIAAKQDKLTKVFYLSQQGCVSDADLTITSTTYGTDNTSAIQAVLNQAGPTNPILVIWDGKYSITGLKIKGNTTIQALSGCGAILRQNSNYSMFENYNINFTSKVDSNITIIGGIWNANGANQSVRFNGTVGTNCAFRFYGVYNLVMRDFKIFRQPTYAIHAINVKKYYVQNFIIDAGVGSLLNTDGIHADGNCEDVVFRDGFIYNTGDDAVAFNADDVWRYSSAGAYPFYPASAAGPIKNVLVDNVHIEARQLGIRILSGGSRVDNFVFRNISGTTAGYACIIDNFQQNPSAITNSGGGNVGTVTFDNFNVSVTGTADFTPYHNCVINIQDDIDHLILKDVSRNDFSKTIPTIWVSGSGTLINTLEVDGYNSLESGTNVEIAHIVIDAAHINKLITRKVNIDRTLTASNNTSFIQVTNGAVVDSWVVNDINLSKIGYLLYSNGGYTPRIVASNVVHTGTNNYSFYTTNQIDYIFCSNYLGHLPTYGPIGQAAGDAFISDIGYSSSEAVTTTLLPGASFLNFPTNDGTLVNTSNVWTTSSGAAGFHYGLSDTKIAAGVSGSFVWKMQSDAGGFVIGLDAANTNTDYTQYDFAVSMDVGGNTNFIQNGTFITSQRSLNTSLWYKLNINRTDNTVKLQSSVDGTTWVDVQNFSLSSNVDYYMKMGVVPGSNKLVYPQKL